MHAILPILPCILVEVVILVIVLLRLLPFFVALLGLCPIKAPFIRVVLVRPLLFCMIVEVESTRRPIL